MFDAMICNFSTFSLQNSTYFMSSFLIFRHHWEMLGMTQILEQVAAVSEQLLQFGINREELLLLEATILVNAGMYSCLHTCTNFQVGSFFL